jgi:hypothetical protein
MFIVQVSCDVSRSPSSSSKRMRCELVDVDTFHTCLTVETFDTTVDLSKYLEDHFSTIFGKPFLTSPFSTTFLPVVGTHNFDRVRAVS